MPKYRYACSNCRRLHLQKTLGAPRFEVFRCEDEGINSSDEPSTVDTNPFRQSRTDRMMVAVGFSPRNEGHSVASRSDA